MAFEIEVAELAADELRAIDIYYRRQIEEAIDQQLIHEPTIETRNRKCLRGVQPSFAHEIPLWELRVGGYRVYYNVDEEELKVSICSLRRKPPHETTEQVV